ncbi:hypothetical protein DMH15_27310 [Streptomyces sp. WAC 06725]|nr:hypothetical protein DMH15_27310 [Streptomyces sp. WAC 06725]
MPVGTLPQPPAARDAQDQPRGPDADERAYRSAPVFAQTARTDDCDRVTGTDLWPGGHHLLAR